MSMFEKCFLYLVVGGLLAGAVDKHHVEKCGDHVSNQLLITIVGLWPGMVAASFVTENAPDDDGCENVEPKGEVK